MYIFYRIDVVEVGSLHRDGSSITVMILSGH